MLYSRRKRRSSQSEGGWMHHIGLTGARGGARVVHGSP
jgi:hypothetical protein